VFAPRPRVDSALVALRRIAPGPAPEVRAVVRAAFSARRKTLVNALAGAGADRARVVAALAAVGLPPAVRPEAVAPHAFAALAQEPLWAG
jgi:16S rRNA (adenine1518-N6/adenine1519-N6)-dimethyltransferase